MKRNGNKLRTFESPPLLDLYSHELLNEIKVRWRKRSSFHFGKKLCVEDIRQKPRRVDSEYTRPNWMGHCEDNRNMF